MSVALPDQGGDSGHWYGMVTQVGRGTSVIGPGAVARVLPGLFKITVFRIRAARAFPVRTVFLEASAAPAAGGASRAVSAGPLTITPAAGRLEDVTQRVKDGLRAEYARLHRVYTKALADHGIYIPRSRSPFIHEYMVECELPANFRVPCFAGGWPQMANLSAVTDTEAMGAFVAALGIAKVVTGFREGAAAAAARGSAALLRQIQEALFVCTLRVYAGVYPDGQEAVDDRSLGCLKLYTNSDCDDMSLTAAAFFDRLGGLPASPSGGGFGPTDVLGVRRRMGRIFACQGMVDSATANPLLKVWSFITPPLAGHVWCVIERKDGGWLHAECTRCVGCHADPEPGLYDCFAPYPGDLLDERGLSVLQTERYRVLCVMYDKVGMWIPCEPAAAPGARRRAGVAYADFLGGRCGEPEYVMGADHALAGETGAAINGLRHRLSHRQIAQIVAASPDAFRSRMTPMPGGTGCPPGMVFGAPRAGQARCDLAMPCAPWAGWQG